jgi:hypothetical protein
MSCFEVALGVVVVEPLAEGGAVVEGDPEVRVGDEEPQAALAETQLPQHQLVEQADHVGTGADLVALVGERALQGAGAAEALAPLQHQHAAPGLRQVCRRGQAVVAAADDDHVPVLSGELRDRSGEADFAELLRDRVHATTSRRPSA